MKYIFMAFVIVPIAEITLLFKVGSLIGFFWTLLIILSTATLGVSLLRKQGLSMLMQGTSRLQQGELPAQELAEGFLIAVSGAFLLTPGFITDSIGFSLLIPAVRQFIIKRYLSSWQISSVTHFTQTYQENSPFEEGSYYSGTTVEGEFEATDERSTSFEESMGIPKKPNEKNS
jgi:UPF0716 protein FxsA